MEIEENSDVTHRSKTASDPIWSSREKKTEDSREEEHSGHVPGLS